MLQFFPASVISIVTNVFIVSFSNECYKDNFYDYMALITSIEGCCMAVHYMIERYQRDVFSLIQLLKGERNRLKFNKKLVKDLIASNLKCKSVLDTVVARANANIHKLYHLSFLDSYSFPKVSAFALRIVNFDQIVISSQDKIVLTVLRSVHKTFSENVNIKKKNNHKLIQILHITHFFLTQCKKYNVDYVSSFGGTFVGVCNMFTRVENHSLNAVTCVLDTMADIAKLNEEQSKTKEEGEGSRGKGNEGEDVTRTDERESLPLIQLRAGVCTGPLIGGLTHLDFLRFGVYGEALSTAILLEETCSTGMCQVSISTWEKTYNSLYYSSQSSVKTTSGKDTVPTYIIAPSSNPSRDDNVSFLSTPAVSGTSSGDAGFSSGCSYQSTQK